MNPENPAPPDQENDLERRLAESEAARAELEKKVAELEARTKTLEDQNEALEKQVGRDALTGLYNRFGFNEQMAREFSLAKRDTGRFVGLLLIDVNDFKKINDTLGHPVGDKALCLVAKVLSGSVRESDSVCRLGGDEFAIILREPLNADSPKIIAERIAAALAAKPLVEGEQTVPLTLSIGGIAAADSTIEQLYQEGDKNLYAAKAKKSEGGSPVVCG
ncbi:MAG: diguanylate cyclase [Patescibacteria group bacterium]|jgi:diguanylate cyclase (GGDEF)-like protein